MAENAGSVEHPYGDPSRLRTACGVELTATHGYSDIVDGLDTLVVAGGIEAEQASKDPSLVERVRSIAPRARRVASVCTGAFILAAAGLLHQRRVTTHWMYSESLAKTYPSIDVDGSLLFVRDGNIYSSGGITAGIDLALALVEEDLGREIALAVARIMVVFPRRAIPVQRLYRLSGRGETARASAAAHLDPRSPGGGSQRASLGRSFGHEPAQFRPALSQRVRRDTGALCRTCARRRGTLQTRTKNIAHRYHRRAVRLRQCRADAAHISALIRC
jgi:transcriptional regulator GlxA family with amidase domain